MQAASCTEIYRQRLKTCYSRKGARNAKKIKSYNFLTQKPLRALRPGEININPGLQNTSLYSALWAARCAFKFVPTNLVRFASSRLQ